MSRAMTKNLIHTRMILIKLKTLCGGNLSRHGELHPDYIGTANDN